jgi:hypothetical protein
MNRSFDYNGVIVAPSRPVQQLRTVKKILHIDSSDRDSVVYPRNGNFVVYFPKNYEKIVSINLKGAIFPPVSTTSVKIWDTTTNTGTAPTSDPSYFFIELDGLNKSDETSQYADRSALTNSVFAKIPVSNATQRVEYSENSNPHQVVYYQPPISKLDRLSVKTRLHGHTGNYYIYWDDLVDTTQDYSFTLEIETLENSFDDFSSIETRIGERSETGFFRG